LLQAGGDDDAGGGTARTARSSTAMSFNVAMRTKQAPAKSTGKSGTSSRRDAINNFEAVGAHDLLAEDYEIAKKQAEQWREEELAAMKLIGNKEMQDEIQEGEGMREKKITRTRRMKMVGKLRKMQDGLRKAFLEIDNDGNASIDKAEVAQLMKSVDPEIMQGEIAAVQEFMFEGDDDGEEGISYPEFVKSFGAFIDTLEGPRTKAESTNAFTTMNGDGTLSQLYENRREVIRKIHDHCPIDKTGQVSCTDFKELLMTELQGTQFTRQQINNIVLAADEMGNGRFQPVKLLEKIARANGTFFDVGEVKFSRGLSYGVQVTEKNKETMAKLLERAGNSRSKIQHILDAMHHKMASKNGLSLHHIFRALDDNHSGFLDAEKIQRSMTALDMPITKEEAHDIVNSCDINGDGNVAFVDFQELFPDREVIFVDQDPNRMREFRRTASLSASGSSMSMSMGRRGSHGSRSSSRMDTDRPTRKWISQFHQGDWRGPSQESTMMSKNNPAFISEGDRFCKHLNPNRVNPTILYRSIRGFHTDEKETTKQSGAFYIEGERHRAKQMVQEARLERKRQVGERVKELCAMREDKSEADINAALEGRHHRKIDYFARLQVYQDNAEAHACRKMYVPIINHAFHTPTKLFFTNENQTLTRRPTMDATVDC
jgi:Ca2+-binding EF-hand superfamily protein